MPEEGKHKSNNDDRKAQASCLGTSELLLVLVLGGLDEVEGTRLLVLNSHS